MYESSGSQFFRTTTGIQSGPDPFDKSRFIMTYFTICYRNIMQFQGKTGKEIPESLRLEFLQKFSANNFEHLQAVE